MADTFDVVVQVYDDVSGELKGDANVKTSAGMTYFSDGESLQEKVDSGEFTSGEQGPEGPPGPNSADLISVVDTEGLLGTPGTVVMSQNLFDAIVDSVANSDDLGFNQVEHRIGDYKGKALYAKTVFVTKSVNTTWQTIYAVPGATLVLIDYGKSYVVDGSLVMSLESKEASGVISRCTGNAAQCYCFLEKTYEFSLSVMYTKD